MSGSGGISIRALAFGLPFLVVLAQAIFLGTGHREPYPALTMPDFSGTLMAPDGSVSFDAIDLTAYFEDGVSAGVPLNRLLSPMPKFTRMVASQVAFRNLDHASDDMRRWLSARLVAFHPGTRATAIEARWYRDTYRVQGGELRRILRVPVSTSRLSLSR